MNCYYCGAYLDSMDTCPNCEADVKIWKKIASISNKLYNDGLERAQVRDPVSYTHLEANAAYV